jgi:DNA-binding PadR family transcriptional regulator
MSTAFVLLGLLTQGPRHGYELKRGHDAQLPGARPLGFGQVYATLGRLERDGLVTAAGTDRDGGPDRVTYRITDEGLASLTDWLSAVEPPVPFVTSALFSRVMVALTAVGREAAHDYLIRQRAAHTTRLREWTARKNDPAATFGDVLAADYAITHLDADLRWLHTTVERVARSERSA